MVLPDHDLRWTRGRLPATIAAEVCQEEGQIDAHGYGAKPMKCLVSGVAVVLLVGAAAVWAEGPENKPAEPLMMRSYPVGDLVLSPRQQAEWLRQQQQAREQGEPDAVFLYDPAQFQPLIDLLTTTVAPETWTVLDEKGNKAGVNEAGRVGWITPYPSNCTLIIRQTADVHGRISARLRLIRQLPALDSTVLPRE
jgi:hypothetical protein